MDIGERRRTVYIEPIEDPMPAETPEPPGPALEPERQPEHQPA
jgi:hypothetical protein